MGPRVHSQVKKGMALLNSSLSSDVRLLSSCEGHFRILLQAWQGNRDVSLGEVGDVGCL